LASVLGRLRDLVAADVIVRPELAVRTGRDHDDLLSAALVLVLLAPRILEDAFAAFKDGLVVAAGRYELVEVARVLLVQKVVGLAAAN